MHVKQHNLLKKLQITPKILKETQIWDHQIHKTTKPLRI